MTKNKHIQLNLLNIIVFVVIGIVFYTGSVTIHNIWSDADELKLLLEQHWRAQARESIKDTIHKFDIEIKNNNIDPYNNDSVAQWCSLNFSGIRNGGPTSDGWSAEIGKEVFLDDQSEDCSKDEFIINGRYFKDEVEMHVDPILAEKVLDRIRAGEPTKYGDNLWWNFDGEPEWIEFAYYPAYTGLNGERRTIKGVKNPNFRRFVFVLGTQSDEIFKIYKPYFNKQKQSVIAISILMIFTFISSISFMIMVIFKRY